jgi:hypothetical protein
MANEFIKTESLKKNCWEFKGNRQRRKVCKEGCSQCLVPQMANYDGINGGKNGGRICWLIIGTLCDKNVQLTFSHKLNTCIKCDFYKSVKQEEGKHLCLPIDIIQNIFNEREVRRKKIVSAAGY